MGDGVLRGFATRTPEEPELAQATSEGEIPWERMTPNDEPQTDPDLSELERLEQSLAELERELEIADASGDEASERPE